MKPVVMLKILVCTNLVAKNIKMKKKTLRMMQMSKYMYKHALYKTSRYFVDIHKH